MENNRNLKTQLDYLDIFFVVSPQSVPFHISLIKDEEIGVVIKLDISENIK